MNSIAKLEYIGRMQRADDLEVLVRMRVRSVHGESVDSAWVVVDAIKPASGHVAVPLSQCVLLEELQTLADRVVDQ